MQPLQGTSEDARRLNYFEMGDQESVEHRSAPRRRYYSIKKHEDCNCHTSPLIPKTPDRARQVYKVFFFIDCLVGLSLLFLCAASWPIVCLGPGAGEVCDKFGIMYWNTFDAILAFYVARGPELIVTVRFNWLRFDFLQVEDCLLDDREKFVDVKRRRAYAISAARVVAPVLFVAVFWGRPSFRCGCLSGTSLITGSEQ